MADDKQPPTTEYRDPAADAPASPPAGIDDLNYFAAYWRCGAPVLRSGDRPCLRRAGWGTDHIGVGRCRGHEGKGLNPGRQFEEGNQAARKHGLYSQVLKGAELQIYEALNATGDEALNLQPEINMQKAKIITYLTNRAGRRVWTEEMETSEPVEIIEGQIVRREVFKKYKGFYIRGDIDDPVLMRALDTLSRLVKQQAIIKGDSVPDALGEMNKELVAAQEQVAAASWGQVNAQPVQGDDAAKREGL